MFFPAKATNQTISIVILAVVCSYCATQSLSGARGSFRTRVMNFHNDKGLTDSGQKCSPPPDNATNETSRSGATDVAQCRTYFRVCLSHYQAKINHSNCTFGSNFTPVYRYNSIDTSTTSNFESRIYFNFAWPGEYTLIIEAWNDRSGTQREIAQPNPRDELIYRHNQSYLNLNPSNDWWINGSRSKDMSLTFAVKVNCEADYYGDNCFQYCKPRNDARGHYYCNATDGSRICMEGWEENFCDKAICKSCVQGKCLSPNNCSCHVGWMGPSCDICIPSETCDPIHGYCNDPGTCICKDGWGGVDCKGDLQYCSHHADICRNGGICLNSSPGNFTCSCVKGFTGRTCSEKVISSPCDQCTCYPTDIGCNCPPGCTTTTSTTTTSTTTTTTTTTSPSTPRAVVETTIFVTDLSTSVQGSYLSDGQKLTLIIVFGVILPIIIMTVAVVTYIVCRTIRRNRQATGNNNNNNKDQQQQQQQQQQHQQNNIQNTRIYNKNKNCEVVIRNDCSKNIKNLNLLTNSMAREKTVSKAAPPFPKHLPPASMPSQSGFDKFNKNLNRQNHHTSLAYDNSYPSKEHYPQNFLPLRPYPRLDEGGSYQHRPPYKSVVVSLEPGSPTKSPKRHDMTIPRHEGFPPVTMDFYYVSSLSSDDSSVFSVHSNEEKMEATVV